MKQTTGRGPIIILLIMTLLAMNVMLTLQFGYGADIGRHQSVGSTVMIDVTSSAQQMNFSNDTLTMTAGGQAVPMLTVEPQGATEKISWSSSDESVASVSDNGTVTAFRSGQAVITASGARCSASIDVVVTSDIFASTSTMVQELSVHAADITVYNRAVELKNQLERCTEDGAAQLHELMRRILDYGTGGGDSAALGAAISAMPNIGLSREQCLLAATACAARWETVQNMAVLSFAGDCTFGRFNEQDMPYQFPAVYRLSGSETYPFDKVKGVFYADSLTVANLECVLTSRTTHRDKQYYFRGDAAYAKILTGSSVEAVNLSNNHSGDYYDEGRSDTMSTLSENGVKYCYNNMPAVIQLPAGGGIKVVLISYSLVSVGYPPDVRENILSLIRTNKSEDTIVCVNLHWGEEKATQPIAWQQAAAREMIDTGADLVIGHHPHVLQGIEQYGGGYIAYSLGNFSFGGNSTAASPETIILRVKLTSRNGLAQVTGISAVPCKITSTGSERNNYQPIPQFGADGQAVINRILSLSSHIDGGINEIEWSGI